MAAGDDRSDLIPIERELPERLAWFIRLRWMAVAGIFGGTWVATTWVVPGVPPAPLYAVGVAVLIYNGLFAGFCRRLGDTGMTPGNYRRLVYLQIGLDWVALAWVIHRSGGIQSPVALAFTFHLIIGAILLSRRAVYVQVGAAALLLGVLALVQELGVRPPVKVVWIEGNVPGGALSVFYHWVALTGVFAISAYLSTSITVQLREKEEELFRSERSLDHAYGRMEVLYDLGQAVNATFDVSQVLGLIAENGAKLTRMKACSVRLLDETGKYLRLGAAYGLSQEYLDKGPIEAGRSPLAAEVLSGKVVQVLNVADDPHWLQYPDEALREGLASMAAVPMQARGRFIGTVRVYSAAPHQFPESEVNFLRNLANLGAVAIESAQAYTDLKRFGEERAWFTRMTTHQLRSPLAAIQGMLDALPYVEPLSEKQADFVRRCQRRVADLLVLLRDLMDLASAQRVISDQEAEPVVLLECLAGAVETARERAQPKGVRLEVPAPEEPAVVCAQPEDIERIFSNLLDNAVKYTPDGGKVIFRIARLNGHIQAEVIDTGIGVAEADQERIFGGFFRTEVAKATEEIGTGLGLSIVKQLVERWGGRIELISALGQGSRFVVTLPAAARSGM